MNFDYDLFVLGAGPGGMSAAQRAAAYGAHVAIAERDKVGDTCVIHGCIPEKLMSYAASFSHILQDADEYGWSKVQDKFDWCRFIAGIDRDINHLSQVHTQHLQEAGVELIYGNTKFLDAHTLDVDGHQITADKILIAVGAKTVKPEIPGMEHALTPRDMFQLKQQPKHLAIIGSDHIAVKFAGLINALSSKVTQVVLGDQILPGQDEELCTTLQERMVKQGIHIITNTSVEKIERMPDGFNLKLSRCQDTLTVDTILCATGRTPNLNGLNLDKAGVEVNFGAITVDTQSRTTQSHIFAVGDCTNRPHWTPAAIAGGHAFADTEFGNKPQIVSYEYIPSAVSDLPDAATVGLTEATAREKIGEAVHCYSKKFQPLFNSMVELDQKVMLKLVVDSNSDRVLGAHMVGEYASEIIQAIGLAIRIGVSKKDFDTMIGTHPTIAEEFFSLR